MPGICIEITSCPATRLVQPAFQPPPSRFSFFLSLFFFLFFLYSSSRSGSSRSIFQFAVPEVERSRLAEASLLISNCRGRGIAASPRILALFSSQRRGKSVGRESVSLQPPQLPPTNPFRPFRARLCFRDGWTREEQNGTSVLEQRRERARRDTEEMMERRDRRSDSPAHRKSKGVGREMRVGGRKSGVFELFNGS